MTSKQGATNNQNKANLDKPFCLKRGAAAAPAEWPLYPPLHRDSRYDPEFGSIVKECARWTGQRDISDLIFAELKLPCVRQIAPSRRYDEKLAKGPPRRSSTPQIYSLDTFQPRKVELNPHCRLPRLIPNKGTGQHPSYVGRPLDQSWQSPKTVKQLEERQVLQSPSHSGESSSQSAQSPGKKPRRGRPPTKGMEQFRESRPTLHPLLGRPFQVRATHTEPINIDSSPEMTPAQIGNSQNSGRKLDETNNHGPPGPFGWPETPPTPPTAKQLRREMEAVACLDLLSSTPR